MICNLRVFGFPCVTKKCAITHDKGNISEITTCQKGIKGNDSKIQENKSEWEEQLSENHGSKANKGMFHILRLWNVPYITFMERSIYYGCGTFHILCLWNVPYIMFVERSIYDVCGLFLTSLPFHHQFPFTAALDPYGEELITSSELFDLADYVKINTNHDYKNHKNGWSSLKAYRNALIFTSISIWFFEE
jgi:hypothetical protein